MALVSLPLVWMLSVTFGFSFVFWAISHDTAQRSFEISGSSLFTLGFAEPEGTARIWLTFVEATIGLGLVALLISYLPTIYAAHHEREKGISVLKPFAGTPPSPVNLLANLQLLGALDNPELWRTSANWLLDLDQTHTAFPALCYFPEASPEESWVASVGSLLDGAALLLSASDFNTEDRAAEEIKGPMMALAYGLPTLVTIGRSAGLPIDAPPRVMALVARSSEPAPDISVQPGRVHRRPGPAPAAAPRPRGRTGAVLAPVRLGALRLRRGPARAGRPHPGLAGRVDDRPTGAGRPAPHVHHPRHRHRLDGGRPNPVGLNRTGADLPPTAGPGFRRRRRPGRRRWPSRP